MLAHAPPVNVVASTPAGPSCDDRRQLSRSWNRPRLAEPTALRASWHPTGSKSDTSDESPTSITAVWAAREETCDDHPAWSIGAGDGAAVVDAACRMLERMVCECPQRATKGVFAPIYHCVSVPDIRPGAYLRDYLLRHGLLAKQHLSEPVILHALLLIERLNDRHAHRGFHLCSSNIHRVLLITVLLSTKLLDDETYNNQYWARVGGVSLPHLNELELYTVAALDYRLSVSAQQLALARVSLLSS